ncbi:plant virulence effector HPE1-like domain-containing protein [Hoeflea olei]|uniref:HMA domain-containing protein n=1 Tax=Hoeflea olei TaxID=1480615 RepID=A0A1C1YQ02_9HYPH|nr:plant virulence effector HPE1-like domain-containing protein [Hoeflea olei]OCW55585.1 hypothetical protein AWJ14_06245 [Hoeflea olei]
MLRLLIAATICASAGAASAGSIEQFAPTGGARTSILEIGCPACAQAEKAKKAEATQVRLAPGEQIVEIRNVDGEMKIYRTENLRGGSPVTMVSKASEADLVALGVAAPKPGQSVATEIPATPKAIAATPFLPPVVTEAPAEPPLVEPAIATTAPPVDTDTRTSALAEMAKPFDPSAYELRLN